MVEKNDVVVVVVVGGRTAIVREADFRDGEPSIQERRLASLMVEDWRVTKNRNSLIDSQLREVEDGLFDAVNKGHMRISRGTNGELNFALTPAGERRVAEMEKA